MAEALGARFLDATGNTLPRGGGSLGELASVDISSLDDRLQQVQLIVACDVTNPLCGEHGASQVFGPQKGNPGDGAAIGCQSCPLRRCGEAAAGQGCARFPRRRRSRWIGCGPINFHSGSAAKGIEIVIEYTGLKQKLATADIVLTGKAVLIFRPNSVKLLME